MTERRPINPQAAVEELWKHAPAHAKAKAERVYLEEFRKTKKALLMKEARCWWLILAGLACFWAGVIVWARGAS